MQETHERFSWQARFSASVAPVSVTDTVSTADLFAKLMTYVLGYSKFVAHGGDFGASITEQLGLRHPELLLSVHVTNVPPQHAQQTKPDDLSVLEREYLMKGQSWEKEEGAFTHIHATKPQTLN